MRDPFFDRPLHAQFPVVWIRYAGADGEISERQLALIAAKVDNAIGAVRFTGICSTRKSHRSFRSDRVLAMADAATGETIERPRKYLEALAKALANPRPPGAAINF